MTSLDNNCGVSTESDATDTRAIVKAEDINFSHYRVSL